MLSRSKKHLNHLSQDIQQLPFPVQNWLKASGALQADPIHHVFIKQKLRMQMDPAKPKWFDATADQLITVSPPAFNWSVKVKTGMVHGITGRDRFENGSGEMVIKLASMVPVAKSKSNIKVDQATLQRFLAEIVWYPSAVLCPYVSWESLDAYSARATMAFQGTSGTGIFYFNRNGEFKEFRAERYKDTGPKARPIEWIVTSEKTETREGIKIPVKLSAAWKLDSGNWTWLKLEVSEITYNS